MDDRHSDDMFELLKQCSSARQLKNLVRAFRPSVNDYPISVPSDQLLRSVRRLFLEYHIPKAAIEELLERAEENGRQHIYLYKASKKAVADKLNDFDAIESVLLDGSNRKAYGLPKFEIRPKGIKIADLRHEHRTGTKYSSWTYKLYGGAERWIKESDNINESGDERVVKYKSDYRREVFILKWHSFGLLEVRIPIGNSRARLAEIRGALLRKIGNVITELCDEIAVEREDVETELATLIATKTTTRGLSQEITDAGYGLEEVVLPTSELDQLARSKSTKWIYVNNSKFKLDGRNVEVGADDEEEDAYDSKDIAKLLKNLSDVSTVRAVIQTDAGDGDVEKVSVDFADGFRNELRIAAQTSPETIEFIIRRTWEQATKKDLPESPVDELESLESMPAGMHLEDIELMSQRFPYLVNAFKRLQQFIDENPTLNYLDPERLRKEAASRIPHEDFAVALSLLVQEGKLEKRYKVRPGPHRRLLSQTFESLDQILNDKISDANEKPINLEEAEIVPVFGVTPKPGVAVD